MTQRINIDGDLEWDHDDECSLDHPCLDCLEEEQERLEERWHIIQEGRAWRER